MVLGLQYVGRLSYSKNIDPLSFFPINFKFTKDMKNTIVSKLFGGQYDKKEQERDAESGYT